MNILAKKKTSPVKRTAKDKLMYVKKNWQLYLFFLMPALLLTIIFKYLPMGGVLIAFEDYNVIDGILGSEWVGLEYFKRFLSSPDFMEYLMNTLKLSAFGLLWGFPIPIILAYKIEGLIILSHTFSSAELAKCNIPIVAIEREAKHICSVDTDNYMGGLQATSLLIRNHCDILIHVNVPVPENVPAHNRITAFEDTCQKYHVPYELMLGDLGSTYETTFDRIKETFETIEEKYPDRKKGIFFANDTYANIFLNLIIQKYGHLPEQYRLVGFDNSPIANEAIVPITTIGQQIDKIAETALELLVSQMDEMKKRKPSPLKTPVHKQITPVLIHRKTTD